LSITAGGAADVVGVGGRGRGVVRGAERGEEARQLAGDERRGEAAAGAGQARVGALEHVADGEAVRRQRRQGVTEDDVVGGAVAVEQRDAAVRVGGQGGAQDRHQRGDAAAGADEDDAVRAAGLRAVDEAAGRRAERLEDVADGQGLGEPGRGAAARDALDRDGTGARSSRGGAQRVGAAQALASDGQVEGDELAGLGGGQRVGRIGAVEEDRARLGCLFPDRGDGQPDAAHGLG
jgi:hypothetical protein